jgi:hypothetical protein
MDEAMRHAVLVKILNERDHILLERQKVRAALFELERQDRVLEHGLADRAAAARVFGHKVGYPLDPRDYETMEKLKAAMAKVRGGREWYPGETTPDPMFEIKTARSNERTDKPSQIDPESLERPRIRDRILDHLKSVGRGLKAAEIREYLLAGHGIKTHEKTVGMTLYRLSQEGLVRRDGRTWFFVPPEAETKSPGGSAPGSIEARSNRKEEET